MAERPTVALCRIEHKGQVYNYGDEVPQTVAKEYPEAVGDKPLGTDEIESMNADELKEALLKASGREGG